MVNTLGVDIERGVVSLKSAFWAIVAVVGIAGLVINWQTGQEGNVKALQDRVNDVEVAAATIGAQYVAQDARISRISEVWAARWDEYALRVAKNEGETRELSSQLRNLESTLTRIERANKESFDELKQSVRDISEFINPPPARERK